METVFWPNIENIILRELDAGGLCRTCGKDIVMMCQWRTHYCSQLCQDKGEGKK